MGRFELPRIAPYAPQAHVSTSSTTSARYYSDFLSPVSGIVSGELVAAGLSTFGITDRDFSLVDIIPKVREVIMNNVAIAVVILVKKFPAPELPNIVWLLPAPSPEPIAAPFPVCKRITKIRKRVQSTCKTVIVVCIGVNSHFQTTC